MVKSKFYNLDTDETLSSNSDYYVPSEKAIKTYVDTNIPTDYVDLTTNQSINGSKTFLQRIQKSSNIDPTSTTGLVETQSLCTLDKNGNTVGMYNTSRTEITNNNQQRVINSNVTGSNWYDLRVSVSDDGEGYVSCASGAALNNRSLTQVTASTGSKYIPTMGWVNNPATSTNVVHRTGTETIGGNKIFNANYPIFTTSTSDAAYPLTIKIPYSRDTAPTSEQYRYIGMYDNRSGDAGAASCYSRLVFNVKNNNTTGIYFDAHKAGDTTSYANSKLGIYYPTTGAPYTEAPTPTEDTTNSVQIDTVGARNTKLQNYALSSDVENTYLEKAQQGTILPNFDAMPVIATYEYDIATTTFQQLFTRTNTETSAIDLQDVAYCRIYVTGTNINAKYDCAFLWKGREGYPIQILAFSYPGTADLALSGLRYMRSVQPKYLNNGYQYIIDFQTSNATARHIKVEVFKTNSKITWMSTATDTTYNSSGHNTNQCTLGTNYGICANDTFINGVVSNATWANSINNSLNKYTLDNAMPYSGEALLANQFTFMNGNKVYPATNKTLAIEPGFGIVFNNQAYNNNVAVGWDRFKEKVRITSLTNIPHATLVRGENCYFRCTTDANGNIYSDNYVTNEMTPGYTWYYVGLAESNTVICLCTTNSHFLTLDTNGKLTAVDGKVFAVTDTSDCAKLDENNTFTGTNTFSSPINGTISTTVSSDSTKELLKASVASNDYFRLMVGGASNAGYAELATADDGNEPIYVRQYKGNFTTLQRTATLLDGSGNTTFPGTVTAGKYRGNFEPGYGGFEYASAYSADTIKYGRIASILINGAFQTNEIQFMVQQTNKLPSLTFGEIKTRVHDTAGTINLNDTDLTYTFMPKEMVDTGILNGLRLYYWNDFDTNQAKVEIWIENPTWTTTTFSIIDTISVNSGRSAAWTFYHNDMYDSFPIDATGYKQARLNVLSIGKPTEDTTTSIQADTVGARNTKLASYALDSNVVHKTGAEGISGDKIFNGIAGVQQETSDTSVGAYVDLIHKINGARKGTIRTTYNSDGSYKIQLGCNGPDSSGPLGISVYRSSDSLWTEAPTPATNDNSTKIATTAFVNNAAITKANTYYDSATSTLYIG